MLAGLVLLTAAIYWPVHRFGTIDFDDADYVSTNRYVQAGFTPASVRYAWTTYSMGNWNPLLWFSFYLDRELFHARPGPMHVENVFLHLVGGIVLWWLLVECTGNLNRSWVVAALFLCHPMHVESVAWISERKDVLSTPLLFAALLAYVRYCRQPNTSRRWINYTLMLVLFALSLLSKTMGITLPAVLLLMDFWPLRRWPKTSWLRLGIEKIPLLLLSLAASIMGCIAQYRTGATLTFADMGLWVRIENAIVCYVIYAVRLLVPVHLAIFYPHPGSRPLNTVIAAASLLAATTWSFYRLRRRFPYAIVGWLWFLGTLVPVIGLVQIGGQAMADRYSYFPSVGLLVVLVWGSTDLLRHWCLTQTVLTAALLTSFAVLCHRQVGFWSSNQTLFTHALDVADDSAVAHVILAHAALENRDLLRAVDEDNLALKHGPYDQAYFGLGLRWLDDDPERACGYFQKAIEMQPRAVLFHVKYSAALLHAGHRDQAIAEAQYAVHLDPGDPDAQEELAHVTNGNPK